MYEILYAHIVSPLCLAINLQSIRIPSILHAANFVLCYLRKLLQTKQTGKIFRRQLIHWLKTICDSNSAENAMKKFI